MQLQKGGENKAESEDFEYILNPIYAPYFHISFRKKRSVQFSGDEMNTIVFGDFNKFQTYMDKVLKSWKISPLDTTINLFTQLES